MIKKNETGKEKKVEIAINWLTKNLPVFILDKYKWTPYRSLFFTILSARSKDERTIVVANKLFEKYPSVEKLSKAKIYDLKKIIKPIGFYNAKSKNVLETAKILDKDYDGKIPNKFEELIKFPGVGRKTANVVLNNVFGKEVIGVDVHVHRIANRIGLVKTEKEIETENGLKKIVSGQKLKKLNKLLVNFGQNICKAKPICKRCGLQKICNYYNERIV